MATSKIITFYDITKNGQITIAKGSTKERSEEPDGTPIITIIPTMVFTQKRQYEDANGDVIGNEVKITRREIPIADLPANMLSVLTNIKAYLYNAGLEDEGML